MNEKELLANLLEISERLAAIEYTLNWTILAKQRFLVGDKVKFSPQARRDGINERTKGGVQTGQVVAVDDGFSIKVLLKGYKRPTSYHHMFFVHK